MRNLVKICNELQNERIKLKYKYIYSFEPETIEIAIKIQKNELIQDQNNILNKLAENLIQFK